MKRGQLIEFISSRISPVSRKSRVRWCLDSFFFRLLLSSCLSWEIYCDDHSSLSVHRIFVVYILNIDSHALLQITFCWPFLDLRSTQNQVNQAFNPTLLKKLGHQASVCPIQDQELI